MVSVIQPEKKISIIECKQGAVRAVRFNVDGGYCLTCGSDKTLKLWNPHKETLLHTYTGHGFEVLDARGSSDNSLLISCGFDKAVFVWNVSTGIPMRKFRGHCARVNCVCFNEESTAAFSGSVDGSVLIWDLRSRNKDAIQVLDDVKDSVVSVTVFGPEILVSSLDGYTRIYDVRNGRLTENCIGESITCSSVSGDGQCILVSTIKSGLQLMDKETGELLAQYIGHETTDIKIESCFTSSDTHILSGSEDGFVYCWDLITSKISHRLGHPGSRVIHSLSHHPTKPLLLTASYGQVWLWGPIEEEECEEVSVIS